MPDTVPDPSGGADRFLKLCSAYKLSQGWHANKRLGDVMMPWQERFFRALGHVNPHTGRRQINEAVLLVGKGSSKSTVLQAVTLAYVLDCAAAGRNYRMDALLLAADLRTAKLLFEGMVAAVLGDPFLKGQFRIDRKEVMLEHRQSGICIRALPCLLNSAVGRRAALAVFDELHQSARGNQFSEFHDQILRSQSNAEQPLRIYATTAAITSPAGIYAEKIGYAKRVQDGDIEDLGHYPALFRMPIEHDADIDFTNQQSWHFGMPSLSRNGGPGTQTTEALAEEVERAVKAGGSELALLLSQRFCVDENERGGASDRHMLSAWDSMPEPVMPERFDGEVGIGVDVGGLADLQSVTVCWRDLSVGPHFSMKTWQFLTQPAYEKQSVEGKTVIDMAIERGTCQLYATPDEMDSATAELIKGIVERCYAFPAIGGDAFGRSGVSARITGATNQPFVDLPQNWRLRGTWEQLEALPLDGQLHIDKCPLLKWNLGNVQVDLEAMGKVFFKKDASSAGHCRIDGVMSMLSALSLCTQEGVKKRQHFDPAAWIG